VGKVIHFKFRLYVAGESSNATQAIANLEALCREYLCDRHQIEIVDVFREPGRALEERVFLTPTLVKLSPPPVRKIIGTLKDRQAVSRNLGLDPPKK
jgi:circadian clock protein KaiB